MESIPTNSRGPRHEEPLVARLAHLRAGPADLRPGQLVGDAVSSETEQAAELRAAFKAGVRAGVALNAELGTHVTLQQMQALLQQMQRMLDRFEELGNQLAEVEQGSAYWRTEDSV